MAFVVLGIIDLEGLSLQHIWNVSPSVAKMVVSLMVVSKLEPK